MIAKMHQNKGLYSGKASFLENAMYFSPENCHSSLCECTALHLPPSVLHASDKKGDAAHTIFELLLEN